MSIPRLQYYDHFVIHQDGMWKQLTSEDVVYIYNELAQRYEIILADIEEIISGYQRRPESQVHPGTANTA